MRFFYIKLIFVLLILTVLALFTMENIDQKVDLVFYKIVKVTDVPVVLIIYLSMVLGAFFTIPAVRKRQKQDEAISSFTQRSSNKGQAPYRESKGRASQLKKVDPNDIIMQNPHEQ